MKYYYSEYYWDGEDPDGLSEADLEELIKKPDPEVGYYERNKRGTLETFQDEHENVITFLANLTTLLIDKKLITKEDMKKLFPNQYIIIKE